MNTQTHDESELLPGELIRISVGLLGADLSKL